ncbi:MAG: IS1 family transposase [Bdellovibrionales bacterium]|nr:IS1 family transposase [Bdellovibrionales bacterium]
MHPQCVYCTSQLKDPSDSPKSVVCFGHFTRKSDLKRLQRYRCLDCKKTFSEAKLSRCYYQKKRHLNGPLYELYVSGLSQRRLAKVLRVNRKTIVRKFLFIGLFAYDYLLLQNRKFPKATSVQFDDLETFEHSKCKPVSVIMAVEEHSRRILGFRVAKMPAKGLLAKVSRKKYGARKDERPQARHELFSELKEFAEGDALFQSDQNPHYGGDLKSHFPMSKHVTYKGRRGCVVGQGELKAGGFDPLFSLNHSFAMARANMNRLFRRTWCTTKKPERLSLHFALYALYHNLSLINKIRTI